MPVKKLKTETVKHSPGPWFVMPLFTKGNQYSLWDENENFPADMSPEGMKANAVLMESAPALLKELKVLVGKCYAYGGPKGGKMDLSRAYAAIDKAEGR